ncbi:MAG: hypothetical protein KGL39_26765 [Patescibacteria group bacterium]|nr:hypothetical protein [Patescibacteria group bacterium]
MTTAKRSLTDEIRRVVEERNTAQAENKRLTADNKRLRADLEHALVRIDAVTQAAKKQHDDTTQSHENARQSLLGEIAMLKDLLSKVTAEKTALEDLYNARGLRISQKEAEIAVLSAENADIKAQLATLDSEFANAWEVVDQKPAGGTLDIASAIVTGK